MASWHDFHSDPRKSYYLFLRQGYGRPAHQAHALVKRIDGMVLDLQQGSPYQTRAVSRLATATKIVGALTTARMSLYRVWESVVGTRGPRSREVQNRLSSRFGPAS